MLQPSETSYSNVHRFKTIIFFGIVLIAVVIVSFLFWVWSKDTGYDSLGESFNVHSDQKQQLYENQSDGQVIKVSDSDNLSMYRANSEHSGVYNIGDSERYMYVMWHLIRHDPIIDPVVYRGVVYFHNVEEITKTSYKHYLYAVDIRDGEELWKFPLDGLNAIVEGPPAVRDNTIYFGVQESDFFALDGVTQRVRWRYPSQAWLYSSPVLADDTVYFTVWESRKVLSEDGNYSVIDIDDKAIVYALSADDGSFLWKVDVKKSAYMPTVGEQMIFVKTKDVLYAFNKQSGEQGWQFTSEAPLSTLPVYDSGKVYVGSIDENFYVLSEVSGEVVYIIPAHTPPSSPALWNNTLYFGSDEDPLFMAISLQSGKELWRITLPQKSIQAPSISDGVVYVGSQDKKIYAIDAKSGDLLWNYDLDSRHDNLSTPPIVSDGVLFLSNANNGLIAGHISQLRKPYDTQKAAQAELMKRLEVLQNIHLLDQNILYSTQDNNRLSVHTYNAAHGEDTILITYPFVISSKGSLEKNQRNITQPNPLLINTELLYTQYKENFSHVLLQSFDIASSQQKTVFEFSERGSEVTITPFVVTGSYIIMSLILENPEDAYKTNYYTRTQVQKFFLIDWVAGKSKEIARVETEMFSSFIPIGASDDFVFLAQHNFESNATLSRLNLNTGEFEDVSEGFSMSADSTEVSPNGSFIAFSTLIQDEQRRLINQISFLDVETGDVVHSQLRSLCTGEFPAGLNCFLDLLWAPDSEAVYVL